jgi:hypothetical protein
MKRTPWLPWLPSSSVKRFENEKYITRGEGSQGVQGRTFPMLSRPSHGH